MNYQKYLPIGTVVMLKGGKKRLMITGFCIIADDDNQKVYDYCGCVFPEGVIKSDRSFLFEHSQIEKIHHLGLNDEEEKNFKNKLNELLTNK